MFALEYVEFLPTYNGFTLIYNHCLVAEKISIVEAMKELIGREDWGCAWSRYRVEDLHMADENGGFSVNVSD
jgi:hypothetical protein